VQSRNDHANVGQGGAERFLSIVPQVNGYRSSIVNRYGPLAVEQRNVRSEKVYENIAVDLTETIKADGEETHQSSID
jgi:hypothetical protein